MSHFVSAADFSLFHSGMVDAMRIAALSYARAAGIAVVALGTVESVEAAACDIACDIDVWPETVQADTLEPGQMPQPLLKLDLPGASSLAGLVASRLSTDGASPVALDPA